MLNNKLGNNFDRAYNLGELTNTRRAGLFTAKDRTDFYQFTLRNRSSINFTLTKPALRADIKLFRSDRSSVTDIFSTRSIPPQNWVNLDPGTYFFKVSSRGGKKRQAYNFTASATTPASRFPIFQPTVPSEHSTR